MVNQITLYKVFEMTTAFRKTHLNTASHVVRLLPQNTVLSFGNLQLDLLFQGFYVARFFPCALSPSGSPKERNLEMSSLTIKGETVQHVVPLCSAAVIHVLRTCAICWGCGKLLVHSTGVNRRCFWNKFHLLPIICWRITGKNDVGVVYESLCVIHCLKTIVYTQK